MLNGYLPVEELSILSALDGLGIRLRVFELGQKTIYPTGIWINNGRVFLTAKLYFLGSLCGLYIGASNLF